MHTCHICKKDFSRAYNLKVHIDTVHKKLKKYQCKICDKKFSLKRALKHHQQTQHREVPKIPPLRLRKTSNGQWTTAENHSRLNETEDLTKVLKSVRPALHRYVKKHWYSMKTHFHEPSPDQRKKGKLHSYYNILWKKDDTDRDWSQKLDEIFNRQTKRFKVNYLCII